MNIKLIVNDKNHIIYKGDELYPTFINKPKKFLFKGREFFLDDTSSLINIQNFINNEHNYIELYYKERI